MLAEDNRINQEVAVGLLSAEGIEVDIANNGLEAVEMVRKRRYDAVLMDVQMPEMDGTQATRRIREDKRWDQLPIIAMTAHAMTGDREKCLAAGMNDYVSKPVDPTELFEVLGKWVTGKRRATAPAAPISPPTVDDRGDGLDALKGFDVADALARLRGNRTLYRKLLGDLVRNHATADQEIKAHLEADDLGAARAAVHTLKGVAGNLSGTALHQAAAGLEAVLARSLAGEEVESGVAESGMDSLSGALSEAVEAVQSLQGGSPAEPRSQPVEPGSEHALAGDELARLAERIREAAGVGDIMDVRGAVEALPAAFPDRARLARMAEDFDLDGLIKLAQELEQGAGQG